MKYLVFIYILINIVAIIIMYGDKQKAINGKERVPEAHLFLTAALFGAFGVFISMYILRHKVRKWYYNIGIPVILIRNLVFIYMCYKIWIISF